MLGVLRRDSTLSVGGKDMVLAVGVHLSLFEDLITTMHNSYCGLV